MSSCHHVAKLICRWARDLLQGVAHPMTLNGPIIRGANNFLRNLAQSQGRKEIRTIAIVAPGVCEKKVFLEGLIKESPPVA